MSDPRVLPEESQRLRALSHPTRIAILNHLASVGSATATDCSRFVGASPSACSWHLRALEKAQWVETMPGSWGRERPWRYIGDLHNVLPSDSSDPVVSAVEAALLQNSRTLEDLFLRRRPSLPKDKADSADFIHGLFWATPDELRMVKDQINAILGPYVNRAPEDRPKGSLRLAATWAVVPWLAHDYHDENGRE